MLPIDRTAKSTLDTNLVNGNTSDAPAIKGSNDIVYNTIDELFNYTAGIYNTDKFTQLGIINVKDSAYKASGSVQTTTGSITTGTATLNVASVIDFAVGQGISVAGAGSAGAALITKINSISGTTLTLAANAITTVTSASVLHDDTAAFKAALLATPSKGVLIVPGAGLTYKLTDNLTFNGKKMVGIGTPTLLFTLPSNKDAFTLLFDEDTRLENVTIDMSNTGQDAIRIRGGNHSKLLDIIIKNVVRDAIHVEGTSQFEWMQQYVFRNIFIQSPGRYGINYRVINGAFINQGIWDNVEIRGAGTNEVHMDCAATDNGGSKISQLSIINGEFDSQAKAGHNASSWYLERTGTQGSIECLDIIGSTFENLGGAALPGYAIGIAAAGFCSGWKMFSSIATNFTNNLIDTSKVTNFLASSSNDGLYANTHVKFENLDFEFVGGTTTINSSPIWFGLDGSQNEIIAFNGYYSGTNWFCKLANTPVFLIVFVKATGQMQFLYSAGATTANTIITISGSNQTTLFNTNGILGAIGGLGIGNSLAATTLGTLTKKMQVFDQNGTSLGFVPIYGTIT